MEKIFSIRNLEVKYILNDKLVNAIRGINFDIYSDEFIALIGESGSGKSTLVKAMANVLDQNSWISNGEIVFTPLKGENMKNKVDKTIDVVEFHQQNLSKYSIDTISEYFKNHKKSIVKEIKLVETLSVEKAFKIEEKLSKKLDKMMIYQYDQNIGKYKFKILKYFQEIKKWRKFIFLQNNEKEKSIYLKSLIKKIEKSKVEEVRVRNISILKRFKLRKFVNIVNFCKENDTKWTDKQIYKYKLYFQGLDYLNDFEKILKKIIDKQLENRKPTIKEMEVLNYKAGIYLHIYTKRKFRKYLIHSKWQGPTLGMVFQNITETLKPSMSIGNQILEVIKNTSKIDSNKAKEIVLNLLEEVGIKNVNKAFYKKPNWFSMADLQRISFAIAIANKPRVLIIDEPLIRIDQLNKTNILNLIYKIKQKYKMTIILVTKDIRFASNFTDRIAIMYAGEIIEFGKKEEILFNSQHPYTWSYVLSLPELNEDGKYKLQGFPPDLTEDIIGDPFAPRNEYALSIDWMYEPPFFKVSDTHYAKTWLLDYRSPKVDRPKKLLDIKKLILKEEGDLDEDKK